MTTDGGRAVPDAAARAAAERWARAAGVPGSVALGPDAGSAPVGHRFVRGLLLGVTAGSLLAALVSASLPAVALAGLLALACTLQLARTASRRRPSDSRRRETRRTG